MAHSLFALLGIAAMTAPAFADEAGDRIQEARAALKRGDADAALKAASKAVELDPKNATAHFYRGEALGTLRKSEEAVRDFEKVLRLDPKMVIAVDRRGGEFFKLGKIKESIEDFDRFIKARPDGQAPDAQSGATLVEAAGE